MCSSHIKKLKQIIFLELKIILKNEKKMLTYLVL